MSNSDSWAYEDDGPGRPETRMSEFGNPVTIHQFCHAHARDYDHTGLYHVGSGRWVGRCSVGVLLTARDVPYLTLEEALADLASVGIRRIAIEWDRLPASTRAKDEPKPPLS